jgi:hypothetical protein
MKSNGIEYRILKNGTGDSFKVEIKSKPFMGIEKWTPLYNHYYYNFGRDSHSFTDIRKPNHPGFMCLVARFSSCEEAKEQVIKFSREPLKNQWTECKC